MTYVPGYTPPINYTSHCDFNKQIKIAAKSDSDYSTRLFMQRNAKKLIEADRLLFIKRNSLNNPTVCYKCDDLKNLK